jgi:hypothetical protein
MAGGFVIDTSKYAGAEITDVATIQATGAVMQCPVRLGLKRDGSDLWTLPIEPLVSIRGAKNIIKRNIAKGVGIGTVKEQFSQDDYQITIQGLFTNFDDSSKLPEADMARLQRLLEAGQSLTIRCKLLDIVGVTLLAVETWEYPATPGMANQAYTVNGLSDHDFDLFT